MADTKEVIGGEESSTRAARRRAADGSVFVAQHPKRSRLVAVGGVAYAACFAALSAVAYALSQGEHLETGRLVEEVDHEVSRVRVLGRFTIYVDATIGDAGADLLTSFLLMLTAGMALFAVAVTAAVAADARRLQWLFLCSAVGATFLAFDEQYELIDSLGYNVPALYLPDILIYTPFLVAFFVAFRGVMAMPRSALAVMALGGVLYVVSQLIDRLPNDSLEGVEEKIEVLCSGVLAVGFALFAAFGVARSTAGGEAVEADVAG